MACSVPGCDRKHWSRGFCSPHYQRWRKTGDAGDALIGAGKGDRIAWLTARAGHQGCDCLVWPFSYDPSGYGAAEYGKKKMGAHRVMCILVHGQPDGRMDAAHSCGNRACVNPKHIRWLTPSENHMEKYKHGTMTNGEKNPAAKLTWDAVKKIRELDKVGLSYTQLAENFGVARSTVARICKRVTWNA